MRNPPTTKKKGRAKIPSPRPPSFLPACPAKLGHSGAILLKAKLAKQENFQYILKNFWRAGF